MPSVPTTTAHSHANVSKAFAETENSASTTTNVQTTTTIATKTPNATTLSALTLVNAKTVGTATVNPAQTKTNALKTFAALETMNAKTKTARTFVSASQASYSMENHVLIQTNVKQTPAIPASVLTHLGVTSVIATLAMSLRLVLLGKLALTLMNVNLATVKKAKNASTTMVVLNVFVRTMKFWSM